MCIDSTTILSGVGESQSILLNMARRVIWAAGINDDRRIARHVSKRFLSTERDAIRCVGGKDKGGVKTDVRVRVTEQIA